PRGWRPGRGPGRRTSRRDSRRPGRTARRRARPAASPTPRPLMALQHFGFWIRGRRTADRLASGILAAGRSRCQESFALEQEPYQQGGQAEERKESTHIGEGRDDHAGRDRGVYSKSLERDRDERAHDGGDQHVEDERDAQDEREQEVTLPRVRDGRKREAADRPGCEREPHL